MATTSTQRVKREAAETATPQVEAGKREHLRALLDRARAAKASKTQPPPTNDGMLPIKCEPSTSNDQRGAAGPRVVSLKRKETNGHGAHAAVVAPLPTPRHADMTPLLPTPGLPATTEAQSGLLPTPTTTYPYDDVPSQRTAHLPAAHAPTPFDYVAHPHHPHYQQPLPQTPHAATPMYATAPPSTHAHSCSCPHDAHYGSSHLHAGAIQWHFQTHAPPPVTIPPPYYSHHHHHHHSLVDSVMDDTPYEPYSTTISPSMSATTSSSSSSHVDRGTGSHYANSRASASSKWPSKHGRASPATKTPQLTNSPLDEYEDHELHSDFVHTVHMLIPGNSFGCLIGHRGEFIKQLNTASECTLSVRDAGSFPTRESDRVLRIYGKPKGICLAQRLVIARIRSYRAQKNDSSYVDLQGETLVPMAESSVTSSMGNTVDSDDAEDDGDVVAQQRQLRWLIHKDNVGKIMGQEGKILKAIARDTKTSLHVLPIKNMAPGSTERAVIITGNPEDIKAALSVIEGKAGGRLEVQNVKVGNAGQYFVIPQHAAGFLIGSQGSHIRKVRAETGGRVQIPAQQDLPLGYVNRTLHIQGDASQMEKAWAMLSRRLQSYLGTAEAVAAAEEDEIVLQLLLPVRICSFLLDQRGRLIREINEKAGASTRFLPPLDDEHRVCVLYGDMPKVLRAERLVLQFIAGDAIANKRATAGGAPPRKRKRAPEYVSEKDEDEDDDDLDDPIDNSGRVVVHYSKETNSGRDHLSGSGKRGRARKQQSASNRTKRRR